MLIGKSGNCLCIAFDQAVLIETSCLSRRSPAIRLDRGLSSARMCKTDRRRRQYGEWNAWSTFARRHGGECGPPIGTRREPSKKPSRIKSHHRTSAPNTECRPGDYPVPLRFLLPLVDNYQSTQPMIVIYARSVEELLRGKMGRGRNYQAVAGRSKRRQQQPRASADAFNPRRGGLAGNEFRRSAAGHQGIACAGAEKTRN